MAVRPSQCPAACSSTTLRHHASTAPPVTGLIPGAERERAQRTCAYGHWTAIWGRLPKTYPTTACLICVPTRSHHAAFSGDSSASIPARSRGPSKRRSTTSLKTASILPISRTAPSPTALAPIHAGTKDVLECQEGNDRERGGARSTLTDHDHREVPRVLASRLVVGQRRLLGATTHRRLAAQRRVGPRRRPSRGPPDVVGGHGTDEVRQATVDQQRIQRDAVGLSPAARRIRSLRPASTP